MKRAAAWAWAIPALAAATGLWTIERWLMFDPVTDVSLHGSESEQQPERAAPLATVEIGAFFERGDGVPSELTGSWPRFRGPHSDNQARGFAALAERWPEDGPPVLWTITLGEGHAGAAVHRGRVYVLDYDVEQRRDWLRCFSLDDGREIWRRGYTVEVKRHHGMSRTVPAVTDRHVVSIGPMGHVMCVDAVTGDFRWGIDLVAEYGSTIPMWHAGQCPLIVDDMAILAPAGARALMIGVDCDTGSVVWSVPNTYGLAMSHSSIMPAVIGDVAQFVYAALGGLVGVRAEAPWDLLWFAPQWDRSVVAPSPVVLPDGRIIVTAGYGGGGMMLSVTREPDGRFSVKTLDSWRASEWLSAEQQTPIVHEGHLFGILPNDAGALRNQFVCIDPDRPREFVWTSGRGVRFGLGPYLLAEDRFFVLLDDGVLAMARATTNGFEELDRRRLMDGRDAFAPMAFADGRLILRDDTRMMCVDVR